MPFNKKPIINVMFDGVLHMHTDATRDQWTAEDPPVDGAIEWIIETSKHFTVNIHSKRTFTDVGIGAMYQWLKRHLEYHLEGRDDKNKVLSETLKAVRFPYDVSEPSIVLDHKAIRFDGTFPSVEELKAFKPWYDRLEEES